MKAPMTKQGHERLQKELERLKKVERPAVIQAIADARALGDLSENAEYHAAKERQAYIEARIREIETKLAEAQIIETHRLTNDKVTFGTTVTVMDLTTKDKRSYMLVGQHESDLKNGRISVHSPVGKALIGHKVGDRVTVSTPAREIEYQIVEITVG
jgi:transcription elongation factor GreA